MTEPFPSGAIPPQPEVPERERDARVEELLLRGLDHYFAGEHDLAINIWTRVLFLDRGHARARAYIERARSAVAERQREAEELVHTGEAAFERGEADAARRLLTTAVERGARADEALALLDRMDRLEAAAVQQESRAADTGIPARGRARGSAAAPAERSPIAWIAAGVVCGIAGVTIALGLLWARGDKWLPIVSPSPASTLGIADEPLPVPSASEVWIARARALKDKGRLSDALSALDAIRHGDALEVQADAMRAEIQQKLLATARGTGSGTPGAPPATAGRGPRP